jgi:hypothetical protein
MNELRDRIVAVLPPPPTWPFLVLIAGGFVIWWRNG